MTAILAGTLPQTTRWNPLWNQVRDAKSKTGCATLLFVHAALAQKPRPFASECRLKILLSGCRANVAQNHLIKSPQQVISCLGELLTVLTLDQARLPLFGFI